MHHPAEQSPLGKPSQYASPYDPALLFPISRATKWQEMGLTRDTLPYSGADYWTCYELSWLEPSGKPRVAIGEFSVPADSPNIIESKSFKLYLNSLNHARFVSAVQLRDVLMRDLASAAGAPVAVAIRELSEWEALGVGGMPGTLLDDLDIAVDNYDRPQIDMLHCDRGAEPISETLHSHLLRSHCPVTGQPDWGSVMVSYEGPRLDREALLRYLIAFRSHADFHEQCVERIYLDLWQVLQPARLTVYARYVRRGGLDINPYRSSEARLPGSLRLVRQ